LRRPGLFSFAFLAATLLSVSPRAQEAGVQDVRYVVLGDDDKHVIDRIAADFYEHDLRPSQNGQIEAATAAAYIALSPEERVRFREERRALWRDMPAGTQMALRDCKKPRYGNLTEAQKAPFRRHALNRLSASGFIDDAAIEDMLRGDI
jgi:hypothetical protein